MFARTRAETRRFFRDTWRKYCQGLALEPLETVVAGVVAAHPEYREVIESEAADASLGPDPADNPFLHLGLHIALIEQLQADRPSGIRAEFQRLRARDEDVHGTEHRVLAILAETLWAAQSKGTMPDENDYLARLRRLS